MISFAIDGILGFSVAPLRFILGLGFVISLLSLIWGLVAIIVKLTGSVPPGGQGWASLTVLVTFLAGIQLIVLGMMGLYVARAYEQGKHRPLYLVASAEGLEAGPSGPAARTPRIGHRAAASRVDPRFALAVAGVAREELDVATPWAETAASEQTRRGLAPGEQLHAAIELAVTDGLAGERIQRVVLEHGDEPAGAADPVHLLDQGEAAARAARGAARRS